MEQQQEICPKVTAIPRRTISAQNSVVSSTNVPPERPPMLDISNKLHALVDEFVSNLSSECEVMANTVSAQAQLLLGHDIAPESAASQRPGNRTAADILNGLKRPSGLHVTDSQVRQDKSHMSHAKANLKEGTSRSRDGGRNAQPVEVLSSDHSSDEDRVLAIKFPKKLFGNQRCAKVRISTARRRSPGIDIVSPLRSPESSHQLDYSYEGDTKSEGAAMQDHETTPHKLKWPEHVEDLDEDGGVGQKIAHNGAQKNKDPNKKSGRSKRDDGNLIARSGSSTEDDSPHNQAGTESEGEDLPVLPKIPVKRRLLNEARAHERRTQRGRPKSTSPQLKKPKTPQIDASVITQLVFGPRPVNSVSNSLICL